MMKTTTKSQKWRLWHKPLRFLESWTLAAALAASVFTTGCGGAGSSSSAPGTPSGPLTVSLSTSTVVAPQDGTPGTVDVTVSGASTVSSVSVAASNLPSGVTSQFARAASGLSGTPFGRRKYGAGRYLLCERCGDERDSDGKPVVCVGDCNRGVHPEQCGYDPGNWWKA